MEPKAVVTARLVPGTLAESRGSCVVSRRLDKLLGPLHILVGLCSSLVCIFGLLS